MDAARVAAGAAAGTAGRACADTLRKTRDGFASLRGSPRELWLVYVMKVLESFGYFSLSAILTIYLTEEFGMSDVAAGAAYGLWGTLSTLYGFLLGPAIDALGVRRALVASFTASACAKLALALCRGRRVALAVLYGPLSAAAALGVPVLTIGVRRATHEANRGAAYGLFYSLMNVAALIAGLSVDAFRLGMRSGLGPRSAVDSGQRLLVLLGALTSAAAAGVALTLRDVRVPSAPPPLRASLLEGDGLAADEDDELESFDGDAPPWTAPLAPLPPAAADDADASPRARRPPPAPMRVAAAPPLPASSAAASARELLHDRRFWQYSAMCVLMVNLKGIFRHVDATLPKFLIRAFGCGAPIGTIYSINPFMIIFLVPLVAAATTTTEHFTMIRRGAWVSALAPLWLAAAQRYWAAVFFVVQLSVGEAAWSPRWYDLTMAMAPEGREGVFTALSSAPLFVAQLPTGMLSGALLSRFCPAEAEAACEPGAPPPPPGFAPRPCQGKPLWAIIGIVTLASPLLITAAAPWLRPAPQAAEAQHQAGPAPSPSPSRPPSPRGGAAARRRLDGVADALTGGFGAARARLAAAWRGAPAAGGELRFDDDDALRISDAEEDDFRAPDGGMHTPLLLRPSGGA